MRFFVDCGGKDEYNGKDIRVVIPNGNQIKGPVFLGITVVP